jgi:hypothetical protein
LIHFSLTILAECGRKKMRRWLVSFATVRSGPALAASIIILDCYFEVHAILIATYLE